MDLEGSKRGKGLLGIRSFAIFLVLFCNVIHVLGRKGGGGGVASVPEEQTCVFFYAATRQVACARNCARFRSDAGMSAGARGAVDSIAAAEVRRQEGRTGAAGVSQSTCQRSGL